MFLGAQLFEDETFGVGEQNPDPASDMVYKYLKAWPLAKTKQRQLSPVAACHVTTLSSQPLKPTQDQQYLTSRLLSQQLVSYGLTIVLVQVPASCRLQYFFDPYGTGLCVRSGFEAPQCRQYSCLRLWEKLLAKATWDAFQSMNKFEGSHKSSPQSVQTKCLAFSGASIAHGQFKEIGIWRKREG